MSEQAYLDQLRHILEHGERTEDRTGTGTLSVFGMQARYDLRDGFPLFTTKRVFWKAVVGELLFFLSGNTNASELEDNGINIWREWGDENRNLGPIYSHQWRNFGGKPDSIPQPKPILPSEFEPNILGVARSSYRKVSGDEMEHLLYQTWRGMVARCYDKNHDAYKYYGLKGVHLSNDWLVFEKFLEDAKSLEGWQDKLWSWDEFQIDKDINGGGFRYSKDDCRWATRSDNQRAKYRYEHIIKNNDGDLVTVVNPVDFYEKNNIKQGNFCSMLRGDRPNAGGWSLVKTRDKWAGVDQVDCLIKSIKENPYSRRHIVSAWNPSDLGDMALPPCHTLWQVKITGKRMDLQLYQRSADMFLGVPFNVASYSLLLKMLCHVTGYKPGFFIHSIGDAHIYLNHIEQVKEQLSRDIRKPPAVGFSFPGPQSIFDFKMGDIILDGYDPHPTIKAPVAV